MELLTLHDDKHDADFTKTFELTSRSFVASSELVKMLIERFLMSPAAGLTRDQLVEWTEKKQRPVRLR